MAGLASAVSAAGVRWGRLAAHHRRRYENRRRVHENPQRRTQTRLFARQKQHRCRPCRSAYPHQRQRHDADARSRRRCANGGEIRYRTQARQLSRDVYGFEKQLKRATRLPLPWNLKTPKRKPSNWKSKSRRCKQWTTVITTARHQHNLLKIVWNADWKRPGFQTAFFCHH